MEHSAAGQRARRSGQITRACLDNGMSFPDACETAAVLLPVLDAMLAQAWDEGYDTGRDDSDFEARGLSTDADAHEFPHDNPYRSGHEAE